MDKTTTITVITLHNIRNYGSALQALATQAVFEALGCEVGFVDFVRSDQRTPAARIKTWCQGFNPIKKAIYALLLYPSFVQQDKVFRAFIKKYLHVRPGQYSTDDDFKHYPVASDIYCTGSDQTWNSSWNKGIIGAMFLDFVPDGVRKIAYAASFGKSELGEWEKEETRKLLSRYAAISVREQSGVGIVRNLNLPEATHVLDPTLQLGKEFWERYAGKRKIKQPYVLVYQLNTNKEFDRYAEEFARRKGVRLVRFCTRLDQMLKCGKAWVVPDVLDFVSAIRYADCVITDSFHATAFSINMNVPPVCIYPNEFGGRIGSILNLTGLESRHLQSYQDFSYLDAPAINFETVNAILEREREKGWKFLKQAIGQSWK